MDVLPVAASFVLAPFTDVDVTIGVDKSSYTASFPTTPLTLIQGAINPNLPPLACSQLEVGLPLSEVYNSSVKSIWAFVH